MYVLSGYGSLGADVTRSNVAALCTQACNSRFDNNDRRNRCVQACTSVPNNDACGMACQPLFDNAVRRNKCTDACRWSFSAAAAGIAPPVTAPELPPLFTSPVAPSTSPTNGETVIGRAGGLPWGWILAGAAVIGGVALLRRSRRSD